VGGQVVEINGCSKIMGQSLARLQWEKDENSSLMMIMMSVYFYLELICWQRGENNICHALLVTYFLLVTDQIKKYCNFLIIWLFCQVAVFACWHIILAAPHNTVRTNHPF
jgi:hypothetical protein